MMMLVRWFKWWRRNRAPESLESLMLICLLKDFKQCCDVEGWIFVIVLPPRTSTIQPCDCPASYWRQTNMIISWYLGIVLMRCSSNEWRNVWLTWDAALSPALLRQGHVMLRRTAMMTSSVSLTLLSVTRVVTCYSPNVNVINHSCSWEILPNLPEVTLLPRVTLLICTWVTQSLSQTYGIVSVSSLLSQNKHNFQDLM